MKLKKFLDMISNNYRYIRIIDTNTNRVIEGRVYKFTKCIKDISIFSSFKSYNDFLKSKVFSFDFYDEKILIKIK